MTQNNTIIEPCCCERQMPALLKAAAKAEDGTRTAIFSTNGDVTMKHFGKSISYMAGPNHRLLLSVATVDAAMLKEVKRFIERGWTTEAVIITRDEQTELVRAQLAGHESQTTYAVDATAPDGVLGYLGERAAVVVVGPILSKVAAGLTYYAATAAATDAAVQPLLSRAKLHRVELEVKDDKADNDDGSPDGEKSEENLNQNHSESEGEQTDDVAPSEETAEPAAEE